MIYLIEGVPGSGKTYWAVKFLYDHYQEYDEIYSNIDNLQVYTEDSELFFKEFKYKDLGLFADGKKRLLILDEFQKIANNEVFKKDNDFYFFFEYHRHYNFDVILIVQTKLALNNRIRNLVDVYIQAQSQRFSFLSRFYYLEKDPATDTVIRRLFLNKDNKVFNLYRSAFAKEQRKVQSVLINKWLMALGLFFGFIVLSFFMVKRSFHKKSDNLASKTTSSNVSTVSVPGVSSNVVQEGNKTFYAYSINNTGLQGSGFSNSSNSSLASINSVYTDQGNQSLVSGSITNDKIVIKESPYRLVGYLEVHGKARYLLFQNDKYYLIYSSKRVHSESEVNSVGYGLDLGVNAGYMQYKQELSNIQSRPVENPLYRAENKGLAAEPLRAEQQASKP